MQEKNEDEGKVILSMKLLENMLRPSYDMSHVLHRLSSGAQSAGLFMVACHPSTPVLSGLWVGVGWGGAAAWVFIKHCKI